MSKENVLMGFRDSDYAPAETTRNIYFGKFSDYPDLNREEGGPLDEALSGAIRGYQVDEDYYVLSDDVIYLTDYNFYGLFENFHSLQHIDFTNIDTSKVTCMFTMFARCESLKSLDLSSFDTSNVTTMQSMFAGCASLESLDLSSFDTSKVTTMGGMFHGCESLTSLDLSNFNTSNVTTMGAMFSECKMLSSLDLSNFDNSKVREMIEMFWGCESLKSVDLSGCDRSKMTWSLMFDSFEEVQVKVGGKWISLSDDEDYIWRQQSKSI